MAIPKPPDLSCKTFYVQEEKDPITLELSGYTVIHRKSGICMYINQYSIPLHQAKRALLYHYYWMENRRLQKQLPVMQPYQHIKRSIK